jgi:hypothetical protein
MQVPKILILFCPLLVDEMYERSYEKFASRYPNDWRFSFNVPISMLFT